VRSILVIAAVAAIGACAARADTVKLGIVDYEKVFKASKKYADNTVLFDNDVKRERAAIEKQNQELTAKKAEFERQKLLYTDAERKKKQDEISALEKAVSEATEAAAQRIKQRYDELIEECHRTLKAIISKYAKEKGFSCILTSTAVLSPDTCIDVTEDILKLVK